MGVKGSTPPQFPQGLRAISLTASRPRIPLKPPAHLNTIPDKIRIPVRLLSAIKGDSPDSPGYRGTSEPHGRTHRTAAFFLPGDRVLFRTSSEGFRSFRNPGSFDYEQYQAGKGLYAQCFLKDKRLLIKIAPASGTFFGSLLKAIRGRIELFRQKTLLWAQKSLDPEPAAFYAAMILGYKLLLDRNWQDHIHQTGLNHMLSDSGLHIGMVAMFVFWLVRRAVRFVPLHPQQNKRQANSPLAGFCRRRLLCLSGRIRAPRIWRSVLTLAVCFAAAFRFRKADSLTVLALAALSILVFDPQNLWQIPFQLTFACVLAIVVVYPRFRGIRLHRVFPALDPSAQRSGHAWLRSLPGRIMSQFEDA